MSRRDARRHSFVMIYQFPFHFPCDTEFLAEAKAFYFDGLKDEAEPSPGGKDLLYFNRATSGTMDRLVQIDGVIAHFLKDWDIERINRIDLALLRLAIYEILCESDVPLGVAINEAVELAKAYGTDDSPAFINGVLSGISKEYDRTRA